jgi:hypothetical protein
MMKVMIYSVLRNLPIIYRSGEQQDEEPLKASIKSTKQATQQLVAAKGNHTVLHASTIR